MKLRGAYKNPDNLSEEYGRRLMSCPLGYLQASGLLAKLTAWALAMIVWGVLCCY